MESLTGERTRLSMGTKSDEATYCGLWVQRLSPGCGLLERSSGVASCEVRLPPIIRREVRDHRLTAYTFPVCRFVTDRGKETCRAGALHNHHSSAGPPPSETAAGPLGGLRAQRSCGCGRRQGHISGGQPLSGCCHDPVRAPRQDLCPAHRRLQVYSASGGSHMYTTAAFQDHCMRSSFVHRPCLSRLTDRHRLACA